QRIVIMIAAVAAVAASVTAHGQQGLGIDRRPPSGTVYTMSNAAGGNAILMFDRLADGRLVQAGSSPTGGNGTGAGLGSQGGLVLTRNERWLLAVNAGSNSLSVLEVRPRGLRLADVEPTGGTQPVSVTEHGGFVYVVHAGSDTIAGFALGRDGHLRPLPGSIRPLSASGAGPAQIAFTPDGAFLLVTEKNTNRLVTFAVDRDGVANDIRVQQASGITPFGFAFGRREQVFVSEAFGGAPDGSATSSYEFNRDGSLTPISASAATGQTSACWAALTPDGRFAYVTNTGSGSITGYAVDFDGQIVRLDEDGRTGVTGEGSTPNEVVITDNGRFLYNVNSGSQTIGSFRIQPDGSLTPLPFATGLPAGANGLASR
ncbi:MAG TPA: beta-propeller fold lactonase family protein, partial [Ilumatobacteraceae bacterium]|nr:beta-propeller fold lactonase family protein [Ilumatobacteraceae bacterium]